MKSKWKFLLPFLGILTCICSCGETSNTSDSIVSPSFDSSSLAPSSSENTSMSSSSKKETLDDFTSTTKTRVFEVQGYHNLYEDINFKNGFVLTKTSTKAEGGPYHKEYLKYYEETQDETPTWSIAQWGSRYDMYDDYLMTRSEDGFSYGYSSKGGKWSNGSFISAKRAGFQTRTGAITLECNAETEYDRPRQKGEDWPALLLGQSFDHHLIQVASLESLVMEAQFEIVKFEDKMNGEAQSNLHAAQLVWYITLQNRNKGSKDYGKYVWLGVPLWDNRNAGKVTDLFAQVDAGTSALMYNSSTRYYYSRYDGKMPEAHQTATATFEVMQVASSAYHLALQRGFFTTTQFEDLYIGGTNFGFEVPGTYNIGVRIDDIGVYYKEL